MMRERILPWRSRSAVWGRLVIRVGILWFLAAVWRSIGRKMLELVMPFILGWGMAVLLDPLVRWGQKKIGGTRKTVSLGVVLFLLGILGGGVTAVVYYAGRELIDLARNWQVMFDAFQNGLDGLEFLFARLFAVIPPELTTTVDITINEFLLWMEQAIPAALKRLGEKAADKFMSLPSFLIAVIMFVMGTYFITVDYPVISKRMERSIGQGTAHLLRQIRITSMLAFGGYLKAQLLLSLGVFCILLLGFLITGQRYAFLMALGLAVIDFIPLLGAGIVMVPWAGIALLTRQFTLSVEIIVIWGVIAVYRQVAEPKIVGDQTGLPPILSLISIYVGMKTGGVIGMIVGPILALIGLNLVRGGILDGLWRDVWAAGRDIAAILGTGKEK